MRIDELSWSSQLDFPLLASLQLFPLLCAGMMLLLRNHNRLLVIGIVSAVTELLLTVYLYASFDAHNATLQFAETYTLFGSLTYHAAADGITVLFALLTAFLTVIVIIYYSQIGSTKSIWRFQAVIFAIEASLMSQFLSVDLLWFVLMSAMQFVFVGILLLYFSTSPEKELALKRYLQFMTVSILLLLAGTIMLGWNYFDTTHHAWSFNLLELVKIQIPKPYQLIIFFLLFCGLAIRIPLFPLHGWMPPIAEHGTVAIAPVYLISIKAGIYGLVRFVFPLMPEAVLQSHYYIMICALAGIFYAAVLAFMQVNLRRLLAYVVISHNSILIISFFSLGYHAFQGGMMMTVNFGLAIAGILFMMGLVFVRTGSLLISRLGGLFDRLPFIGIVFILASLSIIGLPGTPGFDALHIMLEAAVARFGAFVTITAALGNIFAAGILLWIFQRTFLSSSAEGAVHVRSACLIEHIISILLIVGLLGTGIYFETWLELIDTSVQGLAQLYQQPLAISEGIQ